MVIEKLEILTPAQFLKTIEHIRISSHPFIICKGWLSLGKGPTRWSQFVIHANHTKKLVQNSHFQARHRRGVK